MILRDMQPWQYACDEGVTLRGWHSRPSGKPVLHFVHGNGFCGLTYEQTLAPLQEHFDLFVSDMQGHGDSDAGARFLGWQRNAHLLAEVWQQYRQMWQGVPQIACGHSYGAVLSTLAMGQHTALFDAALLLDPTFLPPMMTRTFSLLAPTGVLRHTPLARQARIRSVSWPDDEALWHYFHQRGVFKGWQDECLRSYLQHAMQQEHGGSFRLKCPPHIEAAIFASYTPSLWQAVRQVRVPVRALVGEQSFGFIHRALPALARQNPRFSIELIAGGHCFMQEAPAQTADTMAWSLKLLLRRISASH